MAVGEETKTVGTPLPLPVHFMHAEQSFSLKKRRLPFSSSSRSSSSVSPSRQNSHLLPPRPPSKGCPPLSRVFLQRRSRWTPLSQALIERPPPVSIYDPGKPQSFFSQCFVNLGLIGHGSFGEVYKVRNIMLFSSLNISHLLLLSSDVPLISYTALDNTDSLPRDALKPEQMSGWSTTFCSKGYTLYAFNCFKNTYSYIIKVCWLQTARSWFVLQVRSVIDGHEYAVKRSAQRFRGDSERARCVREALNHERLHPHPHVLGFCAAWEEAERLYIQTELCCTSLLLHAETQPMTTG